MKPTKAIFIGLDNVLIHTKSGNRFPLHSNDWELDIFVIDLIKVYTDNKYLPIIVTNQDSVRDGVVSEKVFLSKMLNICEKLETYLEIEENTVNFLYCIEDGERRIPNNGLIVEAVQEYNVSLEDSVMIGGNELTKRFSEFCYIGKYIDNNDALKLDCRI